MRDVCGLVGYYREQWLGNPCVLVKIGASISFWDVEEWLLMPNGIWLNFKFCWMDGWNCFGMVETGGQVHFLYIGTFVLLCWPLGWCYCIVVIVFTTIDNYNIFWCLQTCHLFSRLSILCWLLPCNKYQSF